MNRKTKKQVKMAVVLLFFVAAGLWYAGNNGLFAQRTGSGTELTGVSDAIKAELQATQAPEQTAAEETKETTTELVVYVCGAVNVPGIYTLAADSRLYEAIALAGGFSAEADPTYHNLARSIADGERIYILSSSETQALTTEQQVNGEEGAQTGSAVKETLINLNTATAEQLMELPGIGEARAADILEYRARIGQFAAIEEIMNVSGIGEAMFEKIRNKITVK